MRRSVQARSWPGRLAQLAQLVAQRPDRDPQDGGRVRAVAQGMAERVEDQQALDLGDRPADPARRRWRRDRCGGWQGARVPGWMIARPRSSSPRARMTARCRQFSSSRTLPRHGGRRRRSSAAGLTSRIGQTVEPCELRGQVPARAAMSCGRSRSGGSCRVTTFRRYKQILAESFRPPTARSRSRLLVAIRRRSTLTGCCRRRGRSRAPGLRAAAWPAGAAPSRRSRRAAAFRRAPPRTCRSGAPRRR